ncbi:uncharacterized protein LOC125494132 [Beta vulgaris subsp. vulgaris]|uniref:uncharacterized protein LOC125494132 n=1 Tax=Beta vulgaris subsp. vulgaris TaxID=3555 RepID=UPI002036E8CC|nr:uncharacterized protein LOC125494132 [Beta vulgaris subsp. vulgaris]
MDEETTRLNHAKRKEAIATKRARNIHNEKASTTEINTSNIIDRSLQIEVDDHESIDNTASNENNVSDYWDIGDPIWECEYCGAMMWFEERAKKHIKTEKPKFSLCCMQGKVVLPLLRCPPQLLSDLLEGKHPRSRNFIENIRPYNMMHSLASKVFSALYIYDTEHEIANRKAAYSSRNPENFEDPLIAQLQDMIDEHNPLAKNFRMARDRFISDSCQNVRLQLIGRRDIDGRTYNLPTTSEVAALIVGDIDTADKRDIIIETRNGKLKQISELHPSYLPLQYPLLFPYGEDRYRVDVFHRDKSPPIGNSKKRDRLTMREWFAYRMQDRKNEPPTILLSRRLCQQFCVDGYTMMEAERLSFVKYNQQSFRADNVKNLRGATERGDTEGASTGSRVVIPAFFTGGHSYMRENYQDAMAICRWYGYPDLFITFTCNQKWPEITRFVSKRGLRPEDRPDIICRVFKMKLDQLVKDLKDKNILGRVRAYKIICAQLPNKDKNQELYDVVTEFMIHGPSGALNHDAPCTTEKKCTKNFPKRFNERTTVDEDGYHVYRRRDSGATVEKNGNGATNLDRSTICLSISIRPGYDRVTATAYRNRQNSEDPKEIDEIKMYYDCRYISPCEAMWRIFGFTIHYRTPAVERLSFHLPDEQTVLYTDDADLESVLERPNIERTKFLS